MNRILQAVLAASALVVAAQATAQVTFYERNGLRGYSITLNGPVDNFVSYAFNDRAASAMVGHGRWLACEDAQFRGRCVVLRPGAYPSLRETGLQRAISSVRPLDGPTPPHYYNGPPVTPSPYEGRG
jgi:hypothetical protein